MMLSRRGFLAAPMLLGMPAHAEAGAGVRGTGDLGLVVERASGSVLLVEHSGQTILARIEGLGDLSHASIVFSPDQREAFVFGRDGGLTKIDLLEQRIVARIIQAGNAIGGAISDDGEIVAVSNYEPGGVNFFDRTSLEPLYEVKAEYAPGQFSKTVGLVDLPGCRFAVSLYDAGEIWLISCGGGAPDVTRLGQAGLMPYDGYVTGDGRHYLAGLFGEDGIAHVDLWQEPPRIRRILPGYGRGQEPLPVYKMPHLEGWGDAGGRLALPAVGRHDVLVVETGTFAETGRIGVHGQPVFCVAQPGGRHVWVNFAPPHNDTVQIVDVHSEAIVGTLKPGPGVLHMEFTPKGRKAWLSVRDADRIDIYDTASREKAGELPARKPSGIFFTSRAYRIGQ